MGLQDWLSLIGSLFGRRPQPKRPRPMAAERTALLATLHQSPFGINSHVAAPDMIGTLADAGIVWYRIDIDWDRIERVEGELDWAELDATIDAVRSRGLSLLGSIAYTPAWSSGVDPNATPELRRGAMPREPTHYLRFVDVVVDRYETAFQALSIWNEPNQPKYFHGTRHQYLNQILRPGLERLRERAPKVVRCGPDLSSSPKRNPNEWLKDTLGAVGDLIDVVTHHQYDGRDTPAGRAFEIDKIRKIITEEGFQDRPLWITETGWKRPEVTDQVQADHLAGMIEVMRPRSEWWTKTFWFDSHGEGEGLLGPQSGDPFPALHRYANTIANSERA